MKKNLELLKNTTVIDFSRLLPGGLCSMILSDLGADVIKIEDPLHGDYIRKIPPLVDENSIYFHILNRNKKSLGLDLKNPSNKDILYKLIKTSDIVIESFRPGVTKRLQIDYDTLKNIKNDLIYCSITGYGSTGPYSNLASHDINYISIAGLVGLSDPPIVPQIQIADISGALYATIGIMAALLDKKTTGKGKFIDISLTDSVIPWLTLFMGLYSLNKKVSSKDLLLSGEYPCYRIYKAKDGYISLGAIEPHFWENFCRSINRLDLIDKQFVYGDQGKEVINSLEEMFITRTKHEWFELFKDKDVCLTPVNNLEEVINDPQIIHRELITELEKIKQINLPIKFNGFSNKINNKAPILGEHTEQILKQLINN